MRYEIELSPEALESLGKLDAWRRKSVKAGIETHLRYEPQKVSKSRIKRMKDLIRPQYRLRIDDIRVYYDIRDNLVEVLDIVFKSESEDWLKDQGVRP